MWPLMSGPKLEGPPFWFEATMELPKLAVEPAREMPPPLPPAVFPAMVSLSKVMVGPDRTVQMAPPSAPDVLPVKVLLVARRLPAAREMAPPNRALLPLKV